MRWIVYAGVGIVLIALLVAAIGAMLPKGHTASRTVHVPMPPDALYALLSDVSQFQSWRGDVTHLQRLPDKHGMPAWIEDTGGMKIPMRFERMERPSLLVGRIDSSDLAFGGTWTYRITPSAAGSELTITEDGEIYNVLFRFMARFVFGYHATLDGYLRNLQVRAAR